MVQVIKIVITLFLQVIDLFLITNMKMHMFASLFRLFQVIAHWATLWSLLLGWGSFQFSNCSLCFCLHRLGSLLKVCAHYMLSLIPQSAHADTSSTLRQLLNFVFYFCQVVLGVIMMQYQPFEAGTPLGLTAHGCRSKSLLVVTHIYNKIT